ncbi:hypothetical protein B7494_g4352 [Chlorociboria aeruginascens]|nr:hypothetical protein B7494_g4352 [Chlorociboria aeruginascens]
MDGEEQQSIISGLDAIGLSPQITANPTTANGSPDAPISAKSPQIFTKFKDLPYDIRAMIWKEAASTERIIRVDLDINMNCARSLEPLAIPVIMHICHESREIGSRIYYPIFSSMPEHSNFPLYEPKEDIIYLPFWVPHLEWKVSECRNLPNLPHGLWRKRETLDDNIPTYLAEVRHLALPLGRSRGVQSHNGQLRSELPGWLYNFKNLETVSFFIEHFPQWYRASEIVLYEPIEVPMTNQNRRLPSELENDISRSLEEFRVRFHPEWEPPTIDIFVIGHQSYEKQGPGFFVPPPQSNPPTILPFGPIVPDGI